MPGLEGIVASQTAISMVDGENGRLIYQGYVIADLAEEMSLEEVAFLLWEGRLPNRSELDALSLELASHHMLALGIAANWRFCTYDANVVAGGAFGSVTSEKAKPDQPTSSILLNDCVPSP